VIDLSPDGTTLAVLSPALRQLQLSGTDASRPWHRTLSDDFDGGAVLQFHPARRVLACAAADHTVALWDLDGVRVMATLKGHGARLISIAFSPDGRRLVSSGLDHTVRVWDWEVGEQLLVLPVSNIPFRARFSPDGLALVNSDHEPPVWTRLAVPWSGASSPTETQAGDAALFAGALHYLTAFDHAYLASGCAGRGDFQKAADRYRLARDITCQLRGESDPQTIRFNQSLNEMLNRVQN
jgi:WD40 repeat protein